MYQIFVLGFIGLGALYFVGLFVYVVIDIMGREV